MFRLYYDLTKFGIVVFALLTGIAGYAMSFSTETGFEIQHFYHFLIGLYFLSSGSLAMNQVQEYELDRKMNRTASRPIAAGKIKPLAGAILSFTMILVGANLLYYASPLSAIVGLVSVVLYNLVYTKMLKPKWAFAAVPGAVPGSLPVTIGYVANTNNIFSTESVYMFLVMFFWQMPHFWALAIKYKDDYARGGVPTLPVVLGVERTIHHIKLYTYGFVAVALSAPFFVRASWAFLFIVVPIAIKTLLSLRKFEKSENGSKWFPFFMWVNFAMLVFLFVPIVDKWGFLIIDRFR